MVQGPGFSGSSVAYDLICCRCAFPNLKLSEKLDPLRAPVVGSHRTILSSVLWLSFEGLNILWTCRGCCMSFVDRWWSLDVIWIPQVLKTPLTVGWVVDTFHWHLFIDVASSWFIQSSFGWVVVIDLRPVELRTPRLPSFRFSIWPSRKQEMIFLPPDNWEVIRSIVKMAHMGDAQWRLVKPELFSCCVVGTLEICKVGCEGDSSRICGATFSHSINK